MAQFTFTNNTYAGEALAGFMASTLLEADSVKRGLLTVINDVKSRKVILDVDDDVVLQDPSGIFHDQGTTALQNESYLDPRNIQGVAFDGSAAINIINGTGLIKASGTTLSYDNNTYLTGISGISAGGDLSGTYPNPVVNLRNGITKSYYNPTSSIQTQLNTKQAALTLTTTGTSGAATLSAGTLNIPQYSGGGSDIYSADGTLTGNRVISMGTNSLSLSTAQPNLQLLTTQPSDTNFVTSLGNSASIGWLILGNNGANYIQAGSYSPGGSLTIYTNCTNAFGSTPNGNAALTLNSIGAATFGYNLTISGALAASGNTSFGNASFGTGSGGNVVTIGNAGTIAFGQKFNSGGGNA